MIGMRCQDPACGREFEPRQPHGRFCSAACRVRWNRRNARVPAEPSAGSRNAARELARLTGARQAGQITHGDYALAAVTLINSSFASVSEALIALGTLAWEGMSRGQTAAAAEERENA